MSEQQPEQQQPKPGEPLENPPQLAELQNQLCPNCTTGVLYVERYDPQALHEKGQDVSAANQLRSGGAYDVHCAHCDFSESRALNPEAAV